MKVEGLKIEGKMLSHMAFDTAHIMKHELTIIAPGNLINERKFYREVITKKRKGSIGGFGKSETIFYFDADSSTYKTIEELLTSIDIEL